jgi:predicted dienelactone hydrolase
LLSGGLRGALRLSRVGRFGHSLGGATAAQAMFEDRRIDAGINLDGTPSGPVVNAGLDRPFMLVDAAQARYPARRWASEGCMRQARMTNQIIQARVKP